MDRTDLELVKDYEVNRVLRERESAAPIPDVGVLLGPNPIHKIRHLDVDEILRRSLPMAVRTSTPKNEE